MKAFLNALATVSTIFFTILMICAVYSMMPKHRIQIALPIPAAVEAITIDHAALDCMAQNIYWEARGESAKGKMMVGLVVMARTKSPHFPDTICGVVYQGEHDSHGRRIHNLCQFSWTCDGRDHALIFDNDIDRNNWEQSYIIAKLVMMGKLKSNIDMDGVVNYHANYVKPFWSKDKNYKLVATVGDHLFYRWKKAMIPSNNTIAMR